MELASCHPSGTLNFEVGPRFLEHLCTTVYFSFGLTKSDICFKYNKSNIGPIRKFTAQ